jgi:predicted nucleic acid-binding protein
MLLSISEMSALTTAKIVANTSPLIAFSSIGELRLLRDLFSRVDLPSAVVTEIVGRGSGRLGAEEVRKEISEGRWLHAARPPEPTPMLALLKTRLDPGEAEAIALAKAEDVPLLVDDREARRIAETLTLDFFGSLGVLKRAKLIGLIGEAKPYVSNMTKAGIYYGDELIAKFLADLGEA